MKLTIRIANGLESLKMVSYAKIRRKTFLIVHINIQLHFIYISYYWPENVKGYFSLLNLRVLVLIHNHQASLHIISFKKILISYVTAGIC